MSTSISEQSDAQTQVKESRLEADLLDIPSGTRDGQTGDSLNEGSMSHSQTSSSRSTDCRHAPNVVKKNQESHDGSTSGASELPAERGFEGHGRGSEERFGLMDNLTLYTSEGMIKGGTY